MLLEVLEIGDDHPDFDRLLRIAQAYFSAVELGERIFGHVLKECAWRAKENITRDAGALRQKLGRRKAMIDVTERPWLTYFSERAVKTGSATQAALDVKRKFKLKESSAAIRMQARRAGLVTPRRHQPRRKK